MNYSYEELRNLTVNILSKETFYGEHVNQLSKLFRVIDQHLLDEKRRQNPDVSIPNGPSGRNVIDNDDSEAITEIFWDLFRQGIITPGINASENGFPWFRVSTFGKKLLKNDDTYFFHDVTSFESILKKEIPKIDDVTMLYLKESMQAYRVGCYLSSTVMLGVATENTFNLLVDTVEQNPVHAVAYKNVFKERMLLSKIKKYKAVLNNDLASLPSTIKEDLETHFDGILSIIRNSRNEAGHPTGKIPSREQCYVLLNLFVPHGKKMYQLTEHFKGP